jgi:2-polyprenyl-6-hydroxyphenyl methylase/3-demethylubiquinone-9 3-methyltransferase
MRSGAYEPGRYSDYYRTLKLDYHADHDEDCGRYRLVREAISIPGLARVLDIGCGSGTFLSSLPQSVEKYGIEPAQEAAAAATRRGIQILGQEEALNEAWGGFFDAVTAIDVAEHVEDLNAFLALICHVLRPGGQLILLTGNRDSQAAKMLGPYWYYLHFSEHVSFLTPNALLCLLEPRFTEIQVVPATHHPIPATQWIRSLVTFPIKWVLVRVARVKRVGFFFCLPAEGDHMLVSARRRT